MGWLLGRILPKQSPIYLGKFLFWIGVPMGILGFLRRTNLSGAIWIAPLVSWAAILLGAGLAWTWLKINQRWGKLSENTRKKPNQGSFILASMVGNTGYLGYPVTLALLGQQYFGWALFYDLLGSTIGTYGFGVALAARFGMGVTSYKQIAIAVVKNPALWSLSFGLTSRKIPLPDAVELVLQIIAWTVIGLSLILIGMRLSLLSSMRGLSQISVSLCIKMLLVPLVLGIALTMLGITGSPRLVMVLQMSMPPAFATLILAEAYNLDRELAVTGIALGCAGLFFTLPLWLWLFGV
ncbi:AEC family transporter [[Phormidium ambiguum] IAM M-71]|uniref:AEC family transporter n=1 Tax=[Phormidium ambiguum] IAM M-71 TaxID=454136 RepID=UPI002E7FBE5D|nr:AEC family transporter [Phormidium ambiguum]